MQGPKATCRHKAAQVTPGQQLWPLGCGLLLFVSASPKTEHALKGAWGCNREVGSLWELAAPLLPMLKYYPPSRILWSEGLILMGSS